MINENHNCNAKDIIAFRPKSPSYKKKVSENSNIVGHFINKKTTSVLACQNNFFSTNEVVNLFSYSSVGKSRDEIYYILQQIIQIFPGKAFFKVPSNFHYQIVNQKTLDLYGIKNGFDIIGRTDSELSKTIMKNRWPNGFERETFELDFTTLNNNKPLFGLKEKPYLNAEGRVVEHTITKIPLYDSCREPLGVLTLATDFDYLQDMWGLREIYKNLYSNKSIARDKFLKHIGLDKFLCQSLKNSRIKSLTEREIDIFILCGTGRTAKEGAKLLGISNRTYEKYIESMKDKLNVICKNEIANIYRQIKAN